MTKKGVFGIGLGDFENAMHNWAQNKSLIEKAIKSECYFEAILLLHQEVELLLRINFTFRTNLIRTILNPNLLFNRSDDAVKLRNEILAETQYSFSLLNQLSFLCGAYDEGIYYRLLKFNKFRNDMVHGFLKGKIKINELKEQIREGKELVKILDQISQANISRDAAILQKCLGADRELLKHLFSKPQS